MLRAVPPVHSPLAFRALLDGLLAIAGGDAHLGNARRKIADHYGTAEILLTDSGTSALTIALRAAVEARPGPVALPAYGCYDLLTACHGASVDIIFYDVRPETLGPDPASLRAALSAGAGVVVLAYLYGIPIDLEVVVPLTRAADAVIVEDAAQGAGGSFRGRPLGSLGDLSVLSFARGKGRTAGAGGAVLTAAPDMVRRIGEHAERLPEGSRLRPWLISVAQWCLGRPRAYSIPRALPLLRLGETRYRDPRPVRRMPATAAAILAAAWTAADADAAVRARHAGHYTRRLSDGPITLVEVPAESQAGYLRYPVLAPRAVGESFVRRTARLGISRAYPLTLPHVKPGGGGRLAGEIAGAAQLAARLLTLPTHGLLRARDVERVSDAAARMESIR